MPEILRRFEHHLHGERIAGERGLLDRVDRQRFVRSARCPDTRRGAPCPRHQRFRADVRDQAAAVAADAQLAVRIDGEVTDFAGDAARTAINASTDEVPRADARCHLDEREVIEATRGAPPALGERAKVGVVVDEHRHFEPLAQLVEPVFAFPVPAAPAGEPVGMTRVHGAGYGDADAQQLPTAARRTREAGVAELGDAARVPSGSVRTGYSR